MIEVVKHSSTNKDAWKNCHFITLTENILKYNDEWNKEEKSFIDSHKDALNNIHDIAALNSFLESEKFPSAATKGQMILIIESVLFGPSSFNIKLTSDTSRYSKYEEEGLLVMIGSQSRPLGAKERDKVHYLYAFVADATEEKDILNSVELSYAQKGPRVFDEYINKNMTGDRLREVSLNVMKSAISFEEKHNKNNTKDDRASINKLLSDIITNCNISRLK